MAVDARILDEAAHWLARQHASDFSDREHAELARWRQQSSAHEEVWRRAQQLQRQMHSIPSALGMNVLDRPRPARGRRQLLRAVAVGLATPMLGWFTYRHLPWHSWSADISTARGEIRTVTLADGSQLLLNTASALNVRFDGKARRIHQDAGEILVETSHATQTQPFIVQTQDGQMQALGTKFMVRKHAHSTTLSVLQGAVRVTPARASRSVVVQAGEQLRFDGQQPGAITALVPQDSAWTQGVLYAEDMRLQSFLVELGRYREGLLLCDPSAADLRVSGIFQLRDTDRILELLTQTLPVRTLQRTRYWVTVTRA